MDNLIERDPYELLPIVKVCKDRFTELYKEVNEAAKQKLLDEYTATGHKDVELRINGHGVGDLKATVKDGYLPRYESEQLQDFALLNGMASISKVIRPEYMPSVLTVLEEHLPEALEDKVVFSDDFERYLDHNGDTVVLSGTHESVPDVDYIPKRITRIAAYGCKPADVLPALEGMSIDKLLLGGADE